MKKIKILAICGSIRENSSNHAIIEEIARTIPSHVTFELYDEMASIPAFDGREDEPESVKQYKNKIQEADGILICTPEYAFGVPGALKNSLDWTVSSVVFIDKPVALITASSVGDKAHEALQHTLTAISAKLRPETTLLIPFVRAKVKEGKIVDDETKQAVDNVVNALLKELTDGN
jgi:chromate reductase, NAD(P)H dehydrogenase (quinone)